MTPTIKFSALPGGFERHLQRKFNNPLFPEADQHLFVEEVEQARARDRQDRDAFIGAFEEAVTQASRLSASVDAEVVLDLKQELERLYVMSASLAGDLNHYQQALQKLIGVCLATIEKGASDDPIALQKLRDEAQARNVFFALLQTPLVADLLRGDEIIQPDELIPTLLTESRDSMRNVMELFEPEQIDQIVAQAEQFVAGLPDATGHHSEARQRLDELMNFATTKGS